jgi:hypothetical protein
LSAQRHTAFSDLALACCVSAALAAFAASAAAQPNLEGFWAPKLEQARSGQALVDELPESAVLINDTGAGELAAGDFDGLTLTPAAIAEVRNYDFADELKRENTCNAPSVAFFMQAPFPMEIYQGAELIVFKMEYYDLYRVVFLDGREHPPATAPHSRSGHSIGRWEGDTLVVDTTHISSGTFMNNGFNHSEALHMVERFRLSPDGATLWLTQVYEDPQVFSGLAARYMAWTRRPGEYVYPYDCDPSYGD